ncbi:hypothetical protein KAI87_14265 [Myxococcota bacterium]|nr:hypothetical protein [Myxococcota bacterium]
MRSDLNEWSQFKGTIRGGSHSGQDISTAVAEAEGEGPADDFFRNTQWIKEIRTLRYIASNYGLYFLPVYASYSMQLQSNIFDENRREPVWFSID